MLLGKRTNGKLLISLALACFLSCVSLLKVYPDSIWLAVLTPTSMIAFLISIPLSVIIAREQTIEEAE